jgi:hypothetical protein
VYQVAATVLAVVGSVVAVSKMVVVAIDLAVEDMAYQVAAHNLSVSVRSHVVVAFVVTSLDLEVAASVSPTKCFAIEQSQVTRRVEAMLRVDGRGDNPV